jgi:hypothetical protein
MGNPTPAVKSLTAAAPLAEASKTPPNMANKRPCQGVIGFSEDGFANCSGSGLSLPGKSGEFVNPKCKCPVAHAHEILTGLAVATGILDLAGSDNGDLAATGTTITDTLNDESPDANDRAGAIPNRTKGHGVPSVASVAKEARLRNERQGRAGNNIICATCGKRLSPKRGSRRMRFCGSACRQSAFRAKKWARRYEGSEPLRSTKNNDAGSTPCNGHYCDRAPHIFGPRHVVEPSIVVACCMKIWFRLRRLHNSRSARYRKNLLNPPQEYRPTAMHLELIDAELLAGMPSDRPARHGSPGRRHRMV